MLIIIFINFTGGDFLITNSPTVNFNVIALFVYCSAVCV